MRIDLTQLSRRQQAKAKKAHPLIRWFEHLCILRNSCAHHARVWNRSFTPVPTAALRTLPALTSLPSEQSERIYGALALISFLLGTLAPGSSWNQKLRALVEDAFEAIDGHTAAELAGSRMLT